MEKIEKIIIHTGDEHQIQADKKILLKYNYFKDIIENVENVNEIMLPFKHSVVVKFLKEWDDVYDDNDLELADFLGSIDYLLLILNQRINNKISHENIGLIEKYHLLHHFIDKLIIYLDETYQSNAFKSYLSKLMGYKSFDLKKIIDSMCNDDLLNFIKLFPLDGTHLRMKIYLDIINLAYVRLGDLIINHLCKDVHKYPVSPLTAYIEKLSDCTLKNHLMFIIEKSISDVVESIKNNEPIRANLEL